MSAEAGLSTRIVFFAPLNLNYVRVLGLMRIWGLMALWVKYPHIVCKWMDSAGAGWCVTALKTTPPYCPAARAALPLVGNPSG
jgi:hypothetical protein